MRALVWLLILSGMAVGLALAARYNDGYVLVVMMPWRVEISLNLFILLLAAGYVVVYILSRWVSHLTLLPKRVAEFQGRRRQANAEHALHDAWRLIQEGRYGHALTSAEKAWPDHTTPGLVALAGWRAASALRDPPRAAPWVERVQSMNNPKLDIARLMMEAELALAERRFKDAQHALQSLTQRGGRHIAALRLSLRAEQGLGNWAEVARLTRQLEKHHGLTPDQAQPLRRHALREVLWSLRDDPPSFTRYWKALDASDRTDPALATEAAQAFATANNRTEARRTIEDALGQQWDARLILAYSDDQKSERGDPNDGTDDLLTRIAQAETWLLTRPRDGALLLTLGRLCSQKQLWGKARSYLEAALAIEPNRAIHLKLAQLYEHLDEPTLANQFYRATAMLK